MVDPATLAVQATKVKYPPYDLCNALQQHLAPRVLQVQGVVSKYITICNSIVAGCMHSVPFTKALLLEDGVEFWAAPGGRQAP